MFLGLSWFVHSTSAYLEPGTVSYCCCIVVLLVLNEGDVPITP